MWFNWIENFTKLAHKSLADSFLECDALENVLFRKVLLSIAETPRGGLNVKYILGSSDDSFGDIFTSIMVASFLRTSSFLRCRSICAWSFAEFGLCERAGRRTCESHSRRPSTETTFPAARERRIFFVPSREDVFACINSRWLTNRVTLRRLSGETGRATTM